MLTELQKTALSIVSQLLSVMYQLNDVEPLACLGCRMVTKAAIQVLFDAGLNGLEIVERAIETGSFEVIYLERYASKAILTSNEVKTQQQKAFDAYRRFIVS